MKIDQVFLDTSFFLRFLDQQDSDHANALAYFKRFLHDETKLVSSAIVLAEYGVQDDIVNLPTREVQILAFDISHAGQTAIFARAAFEAKRKGVIQLDHRNIIPNDTKLIAQAHCNGAEYIVGRDRNMATVIDFLNHEGLTTIQYLDISIPPAQKYGELF